MKFKFHPEAELEFREAIEFCEQREIGLGKTFQSKLIQRSKILLSIH